MFLTPVVVTAQKIAPKHPTGEQQSLTPPIGSFWAGLAAPGGTFVVRVANMEPYTARVWVCCAFACLETS